MKKLEDIRQEINLIDEEIVSLFEKRLNLVLDVAKTKKELGLPIFHSGREEEIINKVSNKTKKEEFVEPVQKLFVEIMKISKGVQTKMLFPYNIVLIGFMGTGKTSVGRQLSTMLAMDYMDIDYMIVKNEGMSISSIFELKGEGYFRELERQITKELESKISSVISCGGGIVLNSENIESLKKNGKVILLKASSETIYSRLMEDSSRPILKSKSEVEIRSLLDKRKALYDQYADIVIETDNKTIDEICNEIIGTVLFDSY